MNLQEIFSDKSMKQKAKTAFISQLLLSKKIKTDELIKYSENAKEVEQASCIESLELASKSKPDIIDEATWKYINKMLKNEAPRIKWESAKVVVNAAKLYSTALGATIKQLLINAEDKGAVVRWATASALGEILKLKTKYNKDLIPILEALSKSIEDNAVKKKYIEALKKNK
ncbi:MAG: hypothetical protein HOP11_13470 [Saprospiraceae bacterium]|nr:hypothetical protein [Saprospiraceae bacterium]